MGQGGYVYVANETPYRLRRTYIHSYQMNSWDESFPAEIDPGESPRFYVEFSEGWRDRVSDDAGEVDYAIGDTGKSFQIRVSASDNVRKLAVDWRNSQGDGFIVFPLDGQLGWRHDGSVNVLVAYKQGA